MEKCTPFAVRVCGSRKQTLGAGSAIAYIQPAMSSPAVLFKVKQAAAKRLQAIYPHSSIVKFRRYARAIYRGSVCGPAPSGCNRFVPASTTRLPDFSSLRATVGVGDFVPKKVSFTSRTGVSGGAVVFTGEPFCAMAEIPAT